MRVTSSGVTKPSPRTSAATAVAQRQEHSLSATTRVLYAPIPWAMSVLLETSLGDITIDLLVDDAPKCCEK